MCVCDIKKQTHTHTHKERGGGEQRPPVAETGNIQPSSHISTAPLRVATGNRLQTNTGKPSEQEQVCDIQLQQPTGKMSSPLAMLKKTRRTPLQDSLGEQG